MITALDIFLLLAFLLGLIYLGAKTRRLLTEIYETHIPFLLIGYGNYPFIKEGFRVLKYIVPFFLIGHLVGYLIIDPSQIFLRYVHIPNLFILIGMALNNRELTNVLNRKENNE